MRGVGAVGEGGADAQDRGVGLVGLDGNGKDRLVEPVGRHDGAEPGLGLELAEEAGLGVGPDGIDHPVLDVGRRPCAAVLRVRMTGVWVPLVMVMLLILRS